MSVHTLHKYDAGAQEKPPETKEKRTIVHGMFEEIAQLSTSLCLNPDGVRSSAEIRRRTVRRNEKL